tara:strand:- start:8572 stop:9258 length:687 start_codon:yes stop_codon:yes gene_type:complete
MEKILIIDDDVELSKLIEEFLETFNYDITIMHEPQPALDFLQKNTMDLIILDIMLPGIDGFQALRKIREDSQVPVIMLTARGEVTDRIVGLELGADDYLAKPFEPRELLARIQSILRRATSPGTMVDILEFKHLIINKLKQEVLLDDEALHLSTSEYEALLLFAENPGKVMDREIMVESLRGITWQSYDRSVDVLVSRLRNKLGDTTNKIRFIKTIHGVGYKFIASPK